MSGDAPSAGRFEGRTHLLPVRIYYEDTDFTGLVYHANYLRYFERGRSDYMRLAGIDHTSLLARPDPLAFTITRIELDFRKACRIDDALVVHTAWDEIRGARSLISQHITRGEDLVAAAKVTAVCITPDGRARRPPKELIDTLSPRFAPASAP